jgi:hypothetical protein
MADIWSVYHGQPGYDALSAMTIAELADWHDRAVADDTARNQR